MSSAAVQSSAMALEDVLACISRAGLTAGDRKAAIRRAIEVRLGADAAEVPQGRPLARQESNSIFALEEALDAVACAAKVERVDITEAKTWLRSRGAAGVASRLARLSKSRNACAHPDVKLLSDIESVGAGVQESDSGSGSCTDAVVKQEEIEPGLIGRLCGRLDALELLQFIHTRSR